MALVGISFVSNANTNVNNKQQSITSTTPITYAQQVTFDSKILGESQVMNIYLPENFAQSSEHHTYPVIFINSSHGSQFFHALTGIVKHLSEVERMPKSIVVSLNDGGHIPDIYVNGMWDSMEKINKYGQPDLYLRHLNEEIFPFLKTHYRANDHRTIIGVSSSALFPLDTFIHAPQTFNAYVFLATSDMIGMGFKKGQTMIEAMAKSLSQRPDRKEYLYFADADSDFRHNIAYPKNLDKLKETLSVYRNKDFNFDVKTFTNEGHYAAFLKTMLGAFEQMYPKKLWAPKYREIIKQPGDAMANIDSFYRALSAKYGFEILPNADRWNNVNNLRFISTRLLRDGRAKEALSLAQRWHLYQPKSLPAVFIWAQALEELTLNKQALKKYQQLVLMAKQQDSERLSEFTLAMENVQ